MKIKINNAIKKSTPSDTPTAIPAIAPLLNPWELDLSEVLLLF